MELDSLHKLIIDFIEKTNSPIFMTGKAGTGKTTFLHYIRTNVTKNLAVVAPTAVAAINAGGVTIHSFFQVPFGPLLPPSKENEFAEFAEKRFSPEKAKLLACLDLLIIDEISMVRADTMDYVDRVLRAAKGSERPFGGTQLLMIGDLYQLSPVYQNEWHLLRKFYNAPYFFGSLVFRNHPILTFELTKVHRQKDPTFVDILNSVRSGSINGSLLDLLNKQHRPIPADEEQSEYVTLTTHNPLVKQLNEQRLAELPGKANRFMAKITGDFPAEAFPTEEELVLKTGALVMFIKNDPSGKRLFYNGKTAKVIGFGGNTIRVSFLDDNSELEVNPEVWENVKYSLSDVNQKINEDSSGSFSQFPLRLAWAITIHKSQGLTFNKAVIDVGAAFAHGQTYVALSRCRSLEGLVLREKVKPQNIITDPLVNTFMLSAQLNIPDTLLLNSSIAKEEVDILQDIFDFTPLKDAWDYLKIILNENPFLHQQSAKEIESSQHLLNDKIKKVGDLFISKELNLKTETNYFQSIPFKERLTKASSYFLPHLKTLNHQINDFHQNYATSALNGEYYTLNVLLAHLISKIALFDFLPTATNSSSLLDTMKTAATNYQSIDPFTKKEEVIEKIIVNPALYKALVHWRKKTSESRKSPDYHILSERAMEDISAKLPRSMKQLSMIKSVGEGKTAAFGEELLKVIRQHLGENDLFG